MVIKINSNKKGEIKKAEEILLAEKLKKNLKGFNVYYRNYWW